MQALPPYTLSQAAERLNLSKKSVQRRLDAGVLPRCPSGKAGTKVLIPAEAVEAIARGEVSAKPSSTNEPEHAAPPSGTASQNESPPKLEWQQKLASLRNSHDD